ncbi:hypothetical protein HY408_01605 [Candidatus Gottesmanbacteria bacterium]|nr:hypothetical protein [Candidatus Gottesmanbacteria bacterium]
MSAEHRDRPSDLLRTSDEVWLWLRRNYRHLDGVFRLTCASGALISFMNVPPPTQTVECNYAGSAWSTVSNRGVQAILHENIKTCIRNGTRSTNLGELVSILVTNGYIHDTPESRVACARRIRAQYPEMFSKEGDPFSAKFVKDNMGLNVFTWIGPINEICPKDVVSDLSTPDQSVVFSTPAPLATQTVWPTFEPTDTREPNYTGALVGGCLALLSCLIGVGGMYLYNRRKILTATFLSGQSPQLSEPQPRWPWGSLPPEADIDDSAPYLNEHNPQDPNSGVQGDGLTQVHLPEPLIIGGEDDDEEWHLPDSLPSRLFPPSRPADSSAKRTPDDQPSADPKPAIETPLNYESTLTDSVRKSIATMREVLKRYGLSLQLEENGVEIVPNERTTAFKFIVAEGSDRMQFAEIGTTTSSSKPEIEKEVLEKLSLRLKTLTKVVLIPDIGTFAEKKPITILLVGYVPKKLFK